MVEFNEKDANEIFHKILNDVLGKIPEEPVEDRVMFRKMPSVEKEKVIDEYLEVLKVKLLRASDVSIHTERLDPEYSIFRGRTSAFNAQKSDISTETIEISIQYGGF